MQNQVNILKREFILDKKNFSMKILYYQKVNKKEIGIFQVFL